MSLGERFRAAREQRGLTLSEVAEHIRIRSVYLSAIEEEHWSAIGAPVYTRGFLRTYARYLGLDPEEAVAAFNASSVGSATPAGGPAKTAPAMTDYREPRSLGALLWVAGAIALALVGFVIYLYFAPPKGGGPNVAAGPSASPAATAASLGQAPSGPAGSPAPSASPSPSVLPQTRTLAIHLTAASWLRVTVDGNISVEGTFPAGTTKTFHGNRALVRVGNAGGVDITVDGKPVAKLGGAGDVAEKAFAL